MKVQRKDKLSRVGSLNLGQNNFNRLSPITEFLKENYHIEINQYDNSQMRIRSLKRLYPFSPRIADISLHMMEEGIQHSDSVIKKILQSPNRTKTYDPIVEYFNSLRDIELSESHIDKLLSYISFREFEDREEGYYKARAGRLIRMWLAATVACAIGDHANEAALVLIGEEEGRGKTSLAKYLCPPPLRDMYCISSANRRTYNIEQAITSSFMILYDEMCGLTPTVAEEFKKAVSAPSLQVKLKGDLCPLTRPRIGSVIATTNNRTGNRHGFLYPSLGTRRFICLHIEDIDFDYRDEVDVDMIWAEALRLSEDRNFRYQLTKEDYAEFEETNQRYMIETPATAAIQQVFSLPGVNQGDDDQWMNATEIATMLRQHRLVKPEMARYMTPQHIGEAMRSLGYARKMVYGTGERLYKYNVRLL